MKLENAIYCGDNLEWMQKMPDEFVDLVYADPPFFSNKHHEIIWHDGAEIRSFEDRWKGGIHHYIEWMRERCFHIHRIMKPTGLFFLHCDYRAVHYLKVMLDEIFGRDAFKNDIAWAYQRWGRKLKSRLGYEKQNILLYGKTKKTRIVNYPTMPWESEEEYIRVRKQKVYIDKNGREYVMSDAGGGKRVRRYIDEAMEYGRPIGEAWTDIPTLTSSAKERLDYPTQKPIKLLERIIPIGTNENDLVLDPFCGCGTTIMAAQRINRKWIGIDVSPTACKLMKREIEKTGATDIPILGLPMNIEDLKQLEPFEFQNWVLGAMGGVVEKKKVHDMGIDGYTFFDRTPVQVKQQEHVGRPVVDDFETAIRRHSENAMKAAKERGDGLFTLTGVIIAFSFTKGAHEEVARAKNEGLDIQLLTVKEVVKEFNE